jgi:hypothetical protein
MRVDTTKKIFSGILIISVILLLSLSMSNAQLTFFNPLYYTGSYTSPSFYPFFPLYDPFFPAYNSIPLLPVYNTAYFNPIPALPTTLPTPAINPNPIASVSAVTTLVALTPVTTIAGVVIADFLINTGNTQVDAVLNLIIQNPALLDNPILLNSLINTGNPDVADALTWLILAI